jgi:hypothetical protein
MASRGSTRLSQPHAGLIDVDKLDAGLFESGAHDIDRSLLRAIGSFCALGPLQYRPGL